MANSLQDQLLGAGLVDAKKAKKVKQQKRKQAKQAPKGQQQSDELKQSVKQAQAKKAEKDREINRQRELERQQREIQAQIKQLIEVNRINRENGETAYQFADGKLIKKIYVTDTLFEQLTRGRIAIVALGDGYELVPSQIADKIAQRDEAAIKVLNERNTSVDTVGEEDPYADYEIPDDLMW